MRTERRPVNRALRQLFALDLIRRHGEAPIFERLVHPEITDGAAGMADSLLRYLPVLPRLPGVASAPPEGEPDPAIRDLLRLRREYHGFLDAQGLFEPSWLSPSEGTLRESTALFFPELLEDFPRFRRLLEKMAGLQIVSLGDLPVSEAPGYLRFPTALEEFREVARRLSGLLDAGVHPGDLAVTLPGWNEAFPYFDRECRLLDVPLVPRRGRPLSDFPGARLFGLLQEAVDGDLEVTRVEALLMDPAIPWREDLPVSRIVSIGRANRSLGRFGSEGSPLDFWSEGLRRPPAASDLAASAKRLFRILTEVRRAPSLGDLRRAIFRLLNGYIDRDAWPVETGPALQRALEILGGLAEAQAATGIQIPDPFSAWRSSLSGTTYVRRSEVVGVPVYDYRVSAGLLPEHHFIPNSHHSATRVTVDPLPGLRGDQKARLQLEPVSFSDDFLRCYSLSGSSVVISGAEEGIAERQMSPDWFPPDHVTAVGDTAEADIDVVEEALFSGSGDADTRLPKEVWPLQWEGILRYAETEGAEAPGGDLPEEVLLSFLGDRLFSEEGALYLSASRLGSYLSCPQKYLLSYLLGLEDADPRAVPEPITPMDEGNLIHETLRHLHQELKDQSGTFSAFSELSEEFVLRRLSEVTQGWGLRNLSTPPLLAETLGYRLGPQLLRALRWEGSEFAEGKPDFVETQLSASPVPEVLLRGKIDLGVALPGQGAPGSPEAPTELAIIDYKRGSTPGVNSLKWTTLPLEEVATLVDGGWDGGKMDVQLPVYLLLARGENRRVLRGQFFSLRGGDDGKLPFDDRKEPAEDRVIGALKVLIEEVRRRLQRGALGIPNRGQGCGSCAFRGICRAKFVSEERYD